MDHITTNWSYLKREEKQNKTITWDSKNLSQITYSQRGTLKLDLQIPIDISCKMPTLDQSARRLKNEFPESPETQVNGVRKGILHGPNLKVAARYLENKFRLFGSLKQFVLPTCSEWKFSHSPVSRTKTPICFTPWTDKARALNEKKMPKMHRRQVSTNIPDWDMVIYDPISITADLACSSR